MAVPPRHRGPTKIRRWTPMAEEKLGPTKEFLKGAEARVRTLFHTSETIWTFLVLPLLGMILWIVLVTTFTKFSSTDALLVVLAFSVWYCTRWLGERIGD